MLETALKAKYVPGTNLQGGLAVVDWRFLLPSLKFKNVLYIGVPSVNDLSVLTTLGQNVYVLAANHIELQKLQQACQNRNLQKFQMVCVDKLSRMPFSTDSIDLIFKNDEKGAVNNFTKENILAELGRVIKLNGIIYFEIKGLAGMYFRPDTIKNYSNQEFKSTQLFWLTPLSKKIRTAQPVWDKKIAQYFFTNVMYGQSLKKRLVSQLCKYLNKFGWLKYMTPRRAVLLQPGETNGRVAQPPRYLKSAAQNSGIDLNGYRFGLSTRGQGNSNKAIFYLFKGKASSPELVIKMTRGPEFNYRLENEFRVLQLLKENKIVKPDTYPEALFFDYHNRLAILGQQAVEGEPFRSRTAANESCPIFQDAVNWLVQLGTAKSGKTMAAPGDVSETLYKLYTSFAGIYKLSKNEKRFLEDKIRSMKESNQEFPLVFQHGDPGTWNILVSKEGRVIFMDWEAGEPQGMPLWDLFYFFRTYGSWVSRKQGNREALKNFRQHFLQPSALNDLLRQVVEKYCQQIGLDHRLIEPLFYICWMHRALKESTRLTRENLAAGHYVNLLRLTMANSEASVLKQLFS